MQKKTEIVASEGGLWNEMSLRRVSPTRASLTADFHRRVGSARPIVLAGFKKGSFSEPS
jgi:hypothetical protein